MRKLSDYTETQRAAFMNGYRYAKARAKQSLPVVMPTGLSVAIVAAYIAGMNAYIQQFTPGV